jgi:hypothetical protein
MNFSSLGLKFKLKFEIWQNFQLRGLESTTFYCNSFVSDLESNLIDRFLIKNLLLFETKFVIEGELKMFYDKQMFTFLSVEKKYILFYFRHGM